MVAESTETCKSAHASLASLSDLLYRSIIFSRIRLLCRVKALDFTEEIDQGTVPAKPYKVAYCHMSQVQTTPICTVAKAAFDLD